MIDCTALKIWFERECRDFPWRQTTDPYAIWISEVMLQQTQAVVVIPYFLKWMKTFPNVSFLASASLDQVIKAWEGLGYYSRARNLHEGAKIIVDEFNGILPDNEQALSKIKGLGPYTVGAILSFAFHKKIEAVDGNVLRVITRFFGLEDDIAKPSTLKMVRQLTYDSLPDNEHWITNEALIELGATVCQKAPKCHLCPLSNSCTAFQKGLTDRLPFKTKSSKTSRLYRSVAVVQCGTHYLVKKGEKGKVMSDLYEFPYVEIEQSNPASARLTINFLKKFGLSVVLKQELNEVKHGFTRFQAHLFPHHFTSEHQTHIEGYEWFEEQALKQLAFSSGHRRILQQLDFFAIV